MFIVYTSFVNLDIYRHSDEKCMIKMKDAVEKVVLGIQHVPDGDHHNALALELHVRIETVHPVYQAG